MERLSYVYKIPPKTADLPHKIQYFDHEIELFPAPLKRLRVAHTQNFV